MYIYINMYNIYIYILEPGFPNLHLYRCGISGLLTYVSSWLPYNILC